MSVSLASDQRKNAAAQPDYRVLTDGVEIGVAWWRASWDGVAYVSLSVAGPEFGARKLYANLGRAAGQDDDNVFAAIWNPAVLLPTDSHLTDMPRSAPKFQYSARLLPYLTRSHLNRSGARGGWSTHRPCDLQE
jgi:uncharacterized protein (DUF736 family)